MDIEQRIGRIHRYGQNHTAQVYNLVLSDTIEGRIFLLLEEKLVEIARTVGKVDAQGDVAEDLRAQILGQLSERLSYDRLYQEALSDPELRRTQVELEAALSNSKEAREVVFDLFQDLNGFSLDDYKPLSDVAGGLDRLVRFVATAVGYRKQKLVRVDGRTYDLLGSDGQRLMRFTLDREIATTEDDIELMGLDHPVVQEELGRWRSLSPEEIGIAVTGEADESVVLSIWLVEASTSAGDRRTIVLPIALKLDGTRVPAVERNAEGFMRGPASHSTLDADRRVAVLHEFIEPILQRELRHRGAADGESGFSAEMVAYVEISRSVNAK